MLAFLFSLPSKLKLWLAISGAVIVAVAGAYLKGRSAGKEASEAAAMKRKMHAIKDAKRIENDVESLSESELDRRLSRWVSND